MSRKSRATHLLETAMDPESKQLPIATHIEAIKEARLLVAANRVVVTQRFGITNLIDEKIVDGTQLNWREDFSEPKIYTHRSEEWGIDSRVYEIHSRHDEIMVAETIEEYEDLIAMFLKPHWTYGTDVVLTILDNARLIT